MSYPKWKFDEMKQTGVDYEDISEVESYDLRMRRLRDVQKETQEIIDTVALNTSQVLLEFGSGTGEFAIEAGKHCSKVIAVDASLTMLEYAKQKAQSHRIHNIDYCHAGFLTYEHTGKPLDVVISQLALHHLPDFWKLVALKRIYSMLRTGGKFYLRDTVYSFNSDCYEEFFENWVNSVREMAGEEIAKDTEIAINTEFSTYDWIMEGLIRQAGFKIDHTNYYRGFLGSVSLFKALELFQYRLLVLPLPRSYV